MSDDIRLKVSWRNHRKRIKLERLLGKEGVLAWLDLLLAVGENKPDGKLTNMTPEDIAIDAKWEGDDPKRLIDVLMECRLLDRNDNYYQIHNWEQHNPFVYHAKDRSEKARKAAAVRWGSVQDDAKKDVSKTSIESSNAPSPTPTPNPNPNPNPEDIEIPLKDNSNFLVSQEKILEYQKSYPHINIEHELRMIRQWNIDNPGKRKTRTGILRHINSWLTGQANKRIESEQKPQNNAIPYHGVKYQTRDADEVIAEKTGKPIKPRERNIPEEYREDKES